MFQHIRHRLALANDLHLISSFSISEASNGNNIQVHTDPHLHAFARTYLKIQNVENKVSDMTVF